MSSEGRELTREYLLETVWDKHGLHASGNNLNQYVSILRRNLSLLGCHELILTEEAESFYLHHGFKASQTQERTLFLKLP